MLKGTILVICGDNLGSHGIDGYLESFQAHHYCRYCTLTKAQIGTGPAYLEGEYRTPESYQCAIQELRDNNMKSCNGIKFDSLFNTLSYFHVANPGLPPCLGHDLFEGVVDYDMAIFIGYFVDKKWFTLDLLNKNLQQFPFKGTDVANRPAAAVSKLKLGGQAVQNWWFLRFFPFMVYGLIQNTQDQVWQLVLKLKEIVELVVSPALKASQVAYLQVLVHEYLTDRKALFPQPLRPKHHFLSHYAWNILMFGPLIRLWTLRFESKHSYFKRSARYSQNFINITFTLAQQHQMFQAYCFSGQMFPNDVLVDKGTLFHPYLYARNIQEAVKYLSPDTKQYVVTDQVCVFGTKYQKGQFLIVKTDGNGKWTFAKILLVLVQGDEVHFVVKQYVSTFLPDYSIYRIAAGDDDLDVVCVKYNDVLDYYPLLSYKILGSYFVTLKNKPSGLD